MTTALILGFFRLLSRIDPLSYASFHASTVAMQTQSYSTALNPGFDSRITILLVLTVVYTALAVAQWRRVDAS